MERVIILDTTLRDGALAPGVRFDDATRADIAQRLEAAGVDIIEAAFPARSEDERRGLSAVVAALQTATTCALCRADEGEIEAAASVLAGAHRSRLHVFAGGVAQQRVEVVERSARAVALAAAAADEVEFSPLDTTRLEEPFLVELARAAAEAGAVVINLSDTLGVALPGDVAALTSTIRAAVPGTISFHGHNDLGLATACALAAVGAGARQLEVCINGLGPRAGNTSLEEVVVALARHGERLGVTTGVDPNALRPLSARVAAASGVPVPGAKAIVGAHVGAPTLEAPLR